MSHTRNWIAVTAAAITGPFLAVLAPNPIAAADPTAPPRGDTPRMERPAEQPKAPVAPLSIPETLKTTAAFMIGVPATPALMLQSTASLLTGIAATPAQILLGSASALAAAGVR